MALASLYTGAIGAADCGSASCCICKGPTCAVGEHLRLRCHAARRMQLRQLHVAAAHAPLYVGAALLMPNHTSTRMQSSCNASSWRDCKTLQGHGWPPAGLVFPEDLAGGHNGSLGRFMHP